MIVGLGHQARVGKDTAASILVEKYGFKRLAFADKLKEMALDIDPLTLVPKTLYTNYRLAELVEAKGWEKAKRHADVRAFLQALGVAARNHLGPDVWVDVVLNGLPDADWVFTDVRFPNEFHALADMGATLIKLTRIGAGAGNHISETALADAEWDIIMGNNGTLEDLETNLVAALGLDPVDSVW